jgi:hypothetical protein
MLSIAFVLLAIGCPEQAAPAPAQAPAPAPPTQPVLPEPVEPGEFTDPAGTLVIVRDLAGFLSDCGCAGETGGVARLPAAVLIGPGTFVFVGQLFMPRFGGRGVAVAELQRQYRHYVKATVQVFNALSEHGTVIWMPDPTEVGRFHDAEVDLTSMDPFRRDNGAFWGNLALSLTDTHLRIGTKQPHEVELPRPDSRGRGVMVTVKWQRPGGNPEAIVHVNEIGHYAAHTQRSHTAREHVKAGIESVPEHAGTVLSSHYLGLGRHIPRHPQLAAIAGAAEVIGVHAGAGSAWRAERIADELIAAEWKECGDCHQTAFEIWSKSPHFKAYNTLLARNRHEDARCLPCHVQEFEIGTNGAASVQPRHKSVTCMTCHSQKTPDKSWALVCETCHTEIADPKGIFRSHMRDVCSSADNPPANRPCSRAR